MRWRIDEQPRIREQDWLLSAVLKAVAEEQEPEGLDSSQTKNAGFTGAVRRLTVDPLQCLLWVESRRSQSVESGRF